VSVQFVKCKAVTTKNTFNYKVTYNEQGLLQFGFEIRQPVTAAWLCFVVEVKNFCLALFVKQITEAK
jgi:hypothetical protein